MQSSGEGIFSINLDGTNEKRLTKNGRDSYPVWSPNGNQIAFLRRYRKQWTLFTMTSDAGGSTGCRWRRLADGPRGRRTVR